ncbi:MAG: ATP-grasp domain-containing protein [Vicinamibacteria bacterium]
MEAIGILYEHPEWFRPLFRELAIRGLPYEPIHAGELRFDPDAASRYSLVVNRMSPSAFLRGSGHAIFSTLHYLSYLHELGVPTVNGKNAYAVEISKTVQLAILRKLGLRHPASRVINRKELAREASSGLRFPVLVKPNVGGSGAGIRKFDDEADLARASADGSLDLGIDHTALVQEVLPASGGHIVRVEVLDGEFLYAIRVYPKPGAGFNLCPADICHEESPSAVPPAPPAGACPVGSGIRVEGCRPDESIIRNALRIADAAQLDVGGVEYLVDDRDGEIYYYDINALSNFVSNAENVVGFDPFVNLVDFLALRAGASTLRH